MLSVSLYFIDNSIFSDSCLQSSIQTFKKTSFFYTTQKSLSTEPPLAMYNPDFFKSKREGKKIKSSSKDDVQGSVLQSFKH